MGNAMSKPFVERNDYWFYSITCKDEDISDSYIGSTKKWGNRKSVHKSQCNNGSTKRVFEYINEYGGWDNWEMIEIGFQKNLTRLEARIMEDILMEELGSTLNDRTAYQSLEEYINYNAEHKKKNYDKEAKSEYNKMYRTQEHVKISNRIRNGRKVQCECGMTIRYDSFSKHLSRSEHNKRLNEQK
jgi:hypothetical protein